MPVQYRAGGEIVGPIVINSTLFVRDGLTAGNLTTGSQIITGAASFGSITANNGVFNNLSAINTVITYLTNINATNSFLNNITANNAVFNNLTAFNTFFTSGITLTSSVVANTLSAVSINTGSINVSGAVLTNSLTANNANVRGLSSSGPVVINSTLYVAGGILGKGIQYPNFKVIADRTDFPTPVGNIITLTRDTCYLVTTKIDLTGNRLVCAGNAAINGTDPNVATLLSTGLNSTTPLISSNSNLTVQDLSLSGVNIFDIRGPNPVGDGIGNAVVIDFHNNHFVNTLSVGYFKDVFDLTIHDNYFFNSANLVIDSSIGNFDLINCVLSGVANNTIINILPNTVVSEEFGVYNCYIYLPTNATGITVDTSVIIPPESYILNATTFIGSSILYTSGMSISSAQAVVVDSKPILNTTAFGRYYMNGNVTVTTLSSSAYAKVKGTTISDANNLRFSGTNNRLTCVSPFRRKYMSHVSLSFTGQNNQTYTFALYNSKLSGVDTTSTIKSTANASGNAENVVLFTVVDMVSGDFIEVYAANAGSNNVNVSELQHIVVEA